jgi:hypothetical protein
MTNAAHIAPHIYSVMSAKTWKYAGELRVGDVWTERAGDREARSYRVIALAPDLVTIRVIGSCLTTGQRRTMDFFIVNRVEVREERSPQ